MNRNHKIVIPIKEKNDFENSLKNLTVGQSVIIGNRTCQIYSSTSIPGGNIIARYLFMY